MAEASPYVAQLETASRRVAEAVGAREWKLVYQSRSGPPGQPWLEPDVRDYLRETRSDAVIAPIGFLSDHMEVIYDLDIEAHAVCDELGVRMVRAAAVGTPRHHPHDRRIDRAGTRGLPQAAARSFAGDGPIDLALRQALSLATRLIASMRDRPCSSAPRTASSSGVCHPPSPRTPLSRSAAYFALHRRAPGKRRPDFRRRAAQKLLVYFSELAGDYRRPQSHHCLDVGECVQNPVRSLVEDQGARFLLQLRKHLAPLRRFRRKEAAEAERIRRQARGAQRAHRGRHPGNRHHRNACVNGRRHHSVAGIGDQRRPGIGDQRDVRPGFEFRDQLARASRFVVLVIADQRFRDIQVLQKFARLARVLASDAIALAQDAPRPQRDVFQIADGRRDDVERFQAP